MNQRWCLVGLCTLLIACDERATQLEDVTTTRAALLGQHAKPWLAWARHQQRHRHHARCPDADEGESESCAWTTYDSGLQGAPATFVYFDPRVRGLAYAVSGGSVWQSTDSGESWSPRGDAEANIITLAADGTDESGLVASTGAGVQRSSDAAASWSTLALSGLPIETLASPVAQPQRVYATIDGGPLLRSLDEGEHWSLAGVHYPAADTFGLSVDPRSALDLLVAVRFYQPDSTWYDGHAGIFRSRDGGYTWRSVYDANFEVHTLVRCLVNPDLLLAGTRAGVARSFDNGETWSMIPIATQTQGTIGLAVNPNDCDDFYALQANQGPLHTRDGGASFSAALVDGLQLTATGSFPGTLAIDPQDAAHVILSTHAGFYASHDSGEHWSVLPVMLLMNVSAIAVSAYKPAEVWLSTWGQGVWKRSSADADWQHIGIDRLPRDYVANLSLDPGSARAIIGADPPLLSADGETFTELPTYSTALSATFHPNDPQVIYLTSQLAGVYKSVDAGQSWQHANGNLPRQPMTAEVIDTRSLAINPQRPDQLFLATNGHGIYRSDDAGLSWSQLLDSPELAQCLVLVPVAGDPSAPPRVYACLSGVSASEDGGSTWTQRNHGLPSLDVSHLLYDPVGGTLYAATGRGVFVLDAGAAAWRPLDRDCNAAVHGIAIMQEAGRRYLVMGAEHGVRRRAL